MREKRPSLPCVHIIVPLLLDRVPMEKWLESNMASIHITGLHVKGFLSYIEASGCRIPAVCRLSRSWPDKVISLVAFQE
jgi:hypothetical protein